ncbi:squalene/phytoene synthase family protein [Neisseriaceae bacterium ESL0693]|nr:squalene/phytoene synthase family protein [Neisseriaceae bacterium ESL0693]
MLPLDYCRQKIKNHPQCGIVGFPFLSVAKRSALLAVHAYATEITAITENYSDRNVALTTLQWWQEQTADLYRKSDQPAHPVLQLLKPAIRQFNLPQAELLVLLQSKQYLLTRSRFSDMEELIKYVRQAGYASGRLTSRILGFQTDETLDYADLVGQVLFMSHLISRIGADARQGRLYLPVKELQTANVPAALILNHQGSNEFNQLMAKLIETLKATHLEAASILPAVDKRRQKLSLAQLACSYALLEEISRDGVANLLRYQLNLPRPRQFRIALKTTLWGLRF